MTKIICFFVLITLLFISSTQNGEAAADKQFKNTIKPILEKHCFSCHGKKKKIKGDLNIKKFIRKAPDKENVHTWTEILKAIQVGDMPPEKKPQLTEDEKSKILSWLEQTVEKNTDIKNISIRRMTKYELDYTLQDIFDMPRGFAGLLPDDDKSKTGFRNNANVLVVTPGYLSIFFEVVNNAVRIFSDKNGHLSKGHNPGSAKHFLSSFMVKAFRKNDIEVEEKEYLSFYDKAFEEDKETAFARTCEAILCSPQFYYLGTNKNNKSLDIAEKLSYFLWSSYPDRELLDQAASGKLKTDKEISEQFNRMVKDKKFKRFITNFSSQWLGMKKIDAVAIFPGEIRKLTNVYIYQFKPLLLKETNKFIEYVFENDMSALNFIKSDFLIINRTLAKYYGIKLSAEDEKKMAGQEKKETNPNRKKKRKKTDFTKGFVKVNLKPGSQRGGLFTQATFLLARADVISRGVWLADRILNAPPPPPPPMVPELDKTIPNFFNMTLTQQLSAHRKKRDCRSCHMKIDPWGMPLESFGKYGEFRTKIELPGEGARNRRKMRFADVDNQTELIDGTKINGVNELKDYIYNKKQRQFSEGLVTKIMTYASSREMNYKDRKDIKELTDKFIEGDHKLKALLANIVLSSQFKGESK